MNFKKKIIALALLVWGPLVWASLEKPFFEAGLSGGAGYIPDYPGAGQSRSHALAFPIFNLRGRVFRSDDEDGTHARIFRDLNLTLDVSLGGSFPADSSQNRARENMPDLVWMGEVGPRLTTKLYGDALHYVKASVAVRMALSTDFTRVDYRGVLLAPALSAVHEELIFRKISVAVRVSPQFATQELHEYFYTVEPQHATPSRPAHRARGGYVGTSLFSVFAFERPEYGIYTGVGASFQEGAANQKSPLFKERINPVAFVGFRWYFYKSEEKGYL